MSCHLICSISYCVLLVMHGKEKVINSIVAMFSEVAGWATSAHLLLVCLFVCFLCWALQRLYLGTNCFCDGHGENLLMQPGVETGLEDICIFASADPVVLLTSACTEGHGHL